MVEFSEQGCKTMDTAEVRIECLKIAVDTSRHEGPPGLVRAAKLYEAYVNEEKKEKPTRRKKQ